MTQARELPPPPTDSEPQPSPLMAVVTKFIPLAIGLAGGAVFYAFVLVLDWAPLNRYFLGHPVAIAATVLFCIAVSILTFIALHTASQQRCLRLLRDLDLMPPRCDAGGLTPSQTWQMENDAGHAARSWRDSLSRLTGSTRSSLLVQRLDEVLTRQSHRSTTSELPEDLRELSIRDADAAHDSLGLIRIIVWAIPMLGFLGTVIGITQTLGGLDFTDGTAAVDRLKSGLYVAFDTTALGLVLSVVAIFLQYPVERSLQGLFVEIDTRVRGLVSTGLPADNPADDQTLMITRLCSGIETAVAQSLATQAELWRETIEEAQAAWRTQHTEGAQQFQQLLHSAMKPALATHADRIEASVERLGTAADDVGTALREQTTAWQNAMQETAGEVQTHRRTLLTHTEAMTELASRQSEQDSALRDALQLVVADRTSTAAPAQAGDPAIDTSVSGAMATLAQAVELLSKRLPLPPERPVRRTPSSSDASLHRESPSAIHRDSSGRAA